MAHTDAWDIVCFYKRVWGLGKVETFKVAAKYFCPCYSTSLPGFPNTPENAAKYRQFSVFSARWQEGVSEALYAKTDGTVTHIRVPSCLNLKRLEIQGLGFTNRPHSSSLLRVHM